MLSKVKELSLKEEYKLLQALESIFYDYHNTELPTQEHGYSIVDSANICVCEAKSDDAKKLILRFIDNENSKNLNSLDFSPIMPLEAQKVKASMEYTLKIIKILEMTDDAITLTAKKDYPICFENKDFKFILAPRVEN